MTERERQAAIAWLLIKLRTGGVTFGGVELPICEMVDAIERSASAAETIAPLLDRMMRPGRQKLGRIHSLED